MDRPKIGNWEAEFLRATLFTPDVLSPTYGDEIWQTVAQAPADEVIRKAALGSYSASGPLESGVLTLNILPGRIDWLLGPANMEAMFEHSLGVFQNQDKKFAQRLLDWFQHPKVAVNRLALGEVLRLPVENRVEAYEALGKLLPGIAPDPETARDFLYQINRPRKSNVSPDILVNRLSKWSAIVLNANFAGVKKAQATMNFVRLEVDISTDVNSQQDLAKDNQLVSLFDEFAELGREIVSDGDVK